MKTRTPHSGGLVRITSRSPLADIPWAAVTLVTATAVALISHARMSPEREKHAARKFAQIAARNLLRALKPAIESAISAGTRLPPVNALDATLNVQVPVLKLNVTYYGEIEVDHSSGGLGDEPGT